MAELPLALADVQAELPVGARAELRVRSQDRPGPGRIADLVIGAGFGYDAIAESNDGDEWLVAARRVRSLADTVSRGMRVLVCGLNPSLFAADAGVGFARPGNRFWPAALASGLVTADRDPRAALLTDRVGMTDLVKRATPGASELRAQEYQEGLARLDRLVRWLRPGAVCFVGLAGWRAAGERGGRCRSGGGQGASVARRLPEASTFVSWLSHA